MNLEKYLSNDFDRNIIDHSARAMKNEKGEVSMYAHPSSVNGNTVDYFVVGNSLIEKNPVNLGKIELCSFDFGAAVALLKAGKKVARAGWNGKGMWITLSCTGSKMVKAEDIWAPHNREFAIANGGEVQVDPYFTMKTAQGTIQSGWLASQADMLAEDWQVVE